MTVITVQHQKRGGGVEGVPTVHALCPFGGMATLYKAAADGTYVRRTHPSAIILLGGTVLIALLFRRAFCGWVCPMGAMQELFATIGRKLKWRRALHSSPVDANLRWLKYLALPVILIFTYVTAELVFSPYDPWAAYSHLSAGLEELRTEFLVGTILLFVTVIGSLVVDRPWCRYLCPFAALLGIISRAGAVRVVRNEETCVHCHRCDRACPVDIRVEEMAQVRTGECLACGECVAVCPAPNTLQFKAGRNVISPLALGLATIALFFGTVFATKAAGAWRSLPGSLSDITEYGGSLDPANIRGFMSLQEVADSYQVSADQLIADLGLAADTDKNTPIKDIMKSVGREVDEVREALAKQMGAPRGSPRPPAPPPTDEPPPADQEPSLQEIKGTMTLAEVETMFGVPADALLRDLSLPSDTPTDVPLKQIMQPLGREVQEVRQAVARIAQPGE